MNGGISIHCVDVLAGEVAKGLFVQLRNGDGDLCAQGHVGDRGLVASARLSDRFENGIYQAQFYVAEFYADRKLTLPETPFLDVVHYRFRSSDPAFHIHLPFKFSPWGYSLFRGN